MNHDKAMELLRHYVDYLLDNSDAENPMWNIEKIREGKPNKWNYIDGCMITATLAMYRITKDKKYLEFADAFMSYFVEEDGSIKTYDYNEYNLDNVNPGKNLFVLYRLTKKEKYRKACDTVRKQLDGQPRTHEGNFWHKKIYPYQVWLDGMYMAQPFYMEYETAYNDMKGCIDSFNQFQTMYKHMRDEKTGLYYHGYDESKEMYWADKTTGCSPNFWLRAMGWYVVALVDVCECINEQMYYERSELIKRLKETIDALIPYQDQSGMFYQVIDRSDVEGNYLETSGTALISYAILKGIRLGILPKSYYTYGLKAFDGTCEKYLSVSADNKPVLSGICLVAGLGGSTHRDGSVEYYLSEPVVENEAKGVAPLLLAYTEILSRETLC